MEDAEAESESEESTGKSDPHPFVSYVVVVVVIVVVLVFPRPPSMDGGCQRTYPPSYQIRYVYVYLLHRIPLRLKRCIDIVHIFGEIIDRGK